MIQGANYTLEIHRSLTRRESTVFNAFDDERKSATMKLQVEPTTGYQEDPPEVLNPSFKLNLGVLWVRK